MAREQVMSEGDERITRVCLDDSQAISLGMYFQSYPDIGLPSQAFYNMLLYDEVTFMFDHLPRSIEQSEWKDAFDQLATDKQIHHMEQDERTPTDEFMMLDLVDRTSLSDDHDDLMNVLYSLRESIPFCMSDEKEEKLFRVTQAAYSSPRIRYLQNLDANAEKESEYAAAKWQIELDIPEIETRSEYHRERLVAESPHGLEFVTYHLVQDMLWISPLELAEFLSDRRLIRDLRRHLSMCARKVGSKAAQSALVKENSDQLETRVGGTKYLLKGVKWALSFTNPFTNIIAVEGIEYLENKYLGSHMNWQLSLSKTNKKIREAGV